MKKYLNIFTQDESGQDILMENKYFELKIKIHSLYFSIIIFRHVF